MIGAQECSYTKQRDGVFGPSGEVVGGRMAAAVELSPASSAFFSKLNILAQPPAAAFDPADVLVRARAEIAAGRDEAFSVMDLNVVRSQAARWRRELPRVRPFYAVKCNPDPEVIRVLSLEGFGFDVASKREMELVHENAVGLKRVVDDVIYANPCKQVSHIRAISSAGVRMCTLDNIDELRKIKQNWPDAKCVVRILGDDSSSICKFNAKFGVAVDELAPILREAAKIGAEVIGISFHVGSGCTSAVPFAKAVEAARRAFDLFPQCGLPEPKFLDLGGGWPGALEGRQDKYASFEDIAALLRPTLDRLFPPESGVTVISEPGRYFVSSAAALYTAVHARRAVYPEVPELVSNHSLHDGSSVNTASPELDDALLMIGRATTPGIVPASPTHAHSPPPPSTLLGGGGGGGGGGAGLPMGYRVYVNDGTYGSLNCIYNDHVVPYPGTLLRANGDLYDGKGPLLECSVWGPTCDSVDKISDSVPLPEMSIGDWIEWPCMGAYTTPAASQFNGMSISNVLHINC